MQEMFLQWIQKMQQNYDKAKGKLYHVIAHLALLLKELEY